MKKYLILPALFMLIQITFCNAFTRVIVNRVSYSQQDSLAAYTGKYQTQQGMQTIYADVYVENGKLTAKSSVGDVLVLDHLSGDNFIISKQGVAVKFIRDPANKVSQISVMGNIAWTRAGVDVKGTSSISPLVKADYVGRYAITMNGQTLYLEVSLKNGQLWATQLWDGGSSALDYVSGDDFIVNALSIPIKFIRDQDKKVIQLLLNGADRFTKVKN